MMLQSEASALTELIDAITVRNKNKVTSLLQQGVSPCGALDSANVTPLHFAAQSNAIEIIKLLILAGADVEAMTQPDGETAYDVARLHGHQEAMVLLKTSGAG